MVDTTAIAEIKRFIGEANTGDDSAPKGVTMPVAKDFADKVFANKGLANKDSWFPDRDLIQTIAPPPIRPAAGTGAC